MAVWNTITKSKIQNYRLDSEFYKKELTILDDKIEIIGSMKLGDIIDELTDYTANGSFASLKYNVTVSDNVNYAKWIRIQNLDSNDFVNNIRYVPFKSYSFLKKSKLFGGELLVSKTGEYLGKAYLFMPNGTNENYTLADNIFLIRLKDLELNGYVFSFINSKLGRKLLLRWSQGTGQPTIIKDSLRSLRLPIINEETKKTFNTLIDEYYIKLKQSQTLYKEAEELLEKELGLDSLEFEKPRSYTTKISKVYSHSRCDSEHFKPKYFQLKELIRNYSCGSESLTLHVNYLKPNINPHSNPTRDYNYIELSGINASLGIVENSEKLKGSETPSRAKRIVQTGNLLVSSVVGSVEKVALVSDDEKGFLASTGFFHFQSDFYTPEYLLILMKSKIIKEQLFQEATGGILSAVSDSNLKNIIIPIVDETIRNGIVSKVKKSHKALKQSKQLLEDAKAKVEALIEEATR